LIVTSGPLIKFLGIGRYLVVSATTFAVTALACTTAPDLQVMIALRTIQVFAAGDFGPAAFVAVFMVTGGSRLPFGVTLLAFVLLFPGSLGTVIAGFAENSLGWQTLFLVQAGIGATLALATNAWVPHQKRPDWGASRACHLPAEHSSRSCRLTTRPAISPASSSASRSRSPSIPDKPTSIVCDLECRLWWSCLPEPKT
jgi:MFS family permease